MGDVIANMSMSLDGFMEDADGDVGRVFAWYRGGDEAVAMPGGAHEFRVSPQSAEHLRAGLAAAGALMCGRRLFDLTKGWGGRHPLDVPVFVVTHRAPGEWGHPEARFTFVTDGVASAVEQAHAVAGDRAVMLASADITRQCLDLGLVDMVTVDLVPVVLGAGTPFLAGVKAPVRLDTPTVVQGHGVTHLSYRVLRDV
jgi:dihydrofolate reductase